MSSFLNMYAIRTTAKKDGRFISQGNFTTDLESLEYSKELNDKTYYMLTHTIIKRRIK